MSEFVQHRTTSATVAMALVSVSAGLAAGGTEWSVLEPLAYVTKQSTPTFSFSEKEVTISEPASIHTFGKEISSVFAVVSEGQESLGAEFEAIWDANAAELYGA